MCHSETFLHNFLAPKHRCRKQKHVTATHQRRTQRTQIFSLTWIWFRMILWYLGPLIQETFLLSHWLSPEVFLTLNSRGKPCNHLYSDQLKNTSTTKHTHTHKVKTKISTFYPLSWTKVLGWWAQCFFMLYCFFFSSCLDSKGAVKTPPHTDHCSTAQNILTHTHTGEVGKKTCLTSPDLTCKFSCRVYGVIKALLLVKSQRVHFERGATSKTNFSLNFPLFFLKSRDSK